MDYRKTRAQAFRDLDCWLEHENWSDARCALYCLTLYTLMRGLAPKLVYEIGVWRGDSTAAILAALKHTNGKLVSCDINKDCAKSIQDSDFQTRWEFHLMPSLELAQSVSEQADVVYIDADHAYESVRDEVVAFWPLLKADGHMILHDTTYLKGGPGKVLRRLQAAGYEAIDLPFAWGFGLVHKRSTDPNQISL